MKSIKCNGIWFKGQYADAINDLLNGKEVTLKNFNNGGWEPTIQMSRFLELLQYTNLKVEIRGESLRQKIIKLE